MGCQLYQIKSNQIKKHIYTAPYVTSESEVHGGDDWTSRAT